MKNSKEAPTVSAGSMADIAFLLLIFFLVTTVIETDAGLDRMLPKIEKEPIIIDRHQRNILEVFVNDNGELLVNKEMVPVSGLKEIAIDFIDNGGFSMSNKAYCDYCKGKKDIVSSDNPMEAIVSLNSNRETSYGDYITVQNELVSAYNELRNRESKRLFSTKYTNMELQYANPETSSMVKKELKERITQIKKMYPLHIIEADIK